MTVYYNKSKSAWLYDFQKNGERYQGYCYNKKGEHVKTKTEAKESENILKAQLVNIPKKRPQIYIPNAYTLGEACRDYFNHIKNDNKKPKNEQGHIKVFFSFWGIEKPLVLINKDEIDRFNEFMLNTPYTRQENGAKYWRSTKTVNRYLDTLKSIVSLAFESEKIEYPRKIKKLKTEEKVPTPVPIEILKLIIENSAEHLVHFINIAVNTGMRLSEMTTLKTQQLHLKDRQIILEGNTKSRKGRVIFINDECFESILYFLRNRGKSEYLITYEGHPIRTPRTAWINAQRRAGIKKPYRIHDMRASFCTLLAQTPNASEYYISMAAGHSNPSVTRRYLAALDTVQRNMIDSISINPKNK